MNVYLVHCEDKDGAKAQGSPFLTRGPNNPAEARRAVETQVLREMRVRAIESGMPDPELRVTNVEVKGEAGNEPLGEWRPREAKPVNLDAYAKKDEDDEGEFFPTATDPDDDTTV